MRSANPFGHRVKVGCADLKVSAFGYKRTSRLSDLYVRYSPEADMGKLDATSKFANQFANEPDVTEPDKTTLASS